jgi:hypothetical protein
VQLAVGYQETVARREKPAELSERASAAAAKAGVSGDGSDQTSVKAPREQRSLHLRPVGTSRPVQRRTMIDWLRQSQHQPPGEPAAMSVPYTYQYKVVTFRESLIGDALDSDKLEKVLNKHAEDGWGLKAITSADVKGRIGPGAVEGLLLTFERPRQ